MAAPKRTYIPAEEADSARQWRLPEFGSSAARIASAEKEARDAARRAEEASREVIEDVEPPTPLNAEVLEAIRAEAEAAGYQEGLEKGLAEGRQQGEQAGREQALAETRTELNQRLTQLGDMLTYFDAPTEAVQSALIKSLRTTLTTLLTRLVYSELSTPGVHIENLLKTCFERLPLVETPPRVHLNPDDLAYLKGEAVLSDRLASARLVADDAISQGGCRVYQGASMVDATLEARLRQVIDDYLNGTDLAETEDSAEATAANPDEGDQGVD